jgi:hypothetical protein
MVENFSVFGEVVLAKIMVLIVFFLPWFVRWGHNNECKSLG